MRILTAVIAIAVGSMVLLGYFSTSFINIQTLLLNWAIILAGVAALAGVFNLITVHGNKVRQAEKNSIYSAVLVISLIATFILGIILRPQHAVMQVILNGIILPVESTLMGLLTITLLYAGIRLLRRRVDVMSIFFIISAVIIFLGSATLPSGDIPLIGTLVRPWLSQIWAMGGARGILIGVALGTLVTGLRVLFGVERPYGGK
ncbi:MAG: hypothetical protein UZ14_CFX002000783 [Chloroflexi bacterium OLB14]|nr:MAG: hypothetical protein UZ14_CFX002000783 [Chloroflexi bacterium OLB14]